MPMYIHYVMYPCFWRDGILVWARGAFGDLLRNVTISILVVWMSDICSERQCDACNDISPTHERGQCASY